MNEDMGNILNPQEAKEMSDNAQEIAKKVLSDAIHKAYEMGVTKEQIQELLKLEELPETIN